MSVVFQIKDGKGKPIMVVTERDQQPLNDDLRRLVISMQAVLRRRYPNELERKVVTTVIIRELGGA